MNILIINAHWGNRGDEAAVRAMIDSLRERVPIDRMSIMLLSPRAESFPYSDVEILRYYPWLPAPLYRIDALLTILTLGRLSLTGRGRRFLRALGRADAVIHAPGGPAIGDLYSGNWFGHSYLYRLLMAKVVRRKPFFFYAPSMGPFTSKGLNRLRKFLLKRADLITLRDEISAGYLRDQLGLDATVTLDSAFQNEVPASYLDRYDGIEDIRRVIERGRTVGMVITDLRWHPTHSRAPGLADRIMRSSAEIAARILEKGYTLLLLPQLFGEQDDAPLLERIRALDPERIMMCPPHVDAYGQQALISRLHTMVSMRYHPSIFAAKGNVPFISICYEHKARGFARAAGLSDFALDVEDMTAQAVLDRFDALERDHDLLTRRLAGLNPVLRERSRETTRLIVEALSRLPARRNWQTRQV